jgi:uncharacterized protein (DUF433 family)
MGAAMEETPEEKKGTPLVSGTRIVASPIVQTADGEKSLQEFLKALPTWT